MRERRERRGEYENREGKEKFLKTDVPKLYAYNGCEHSVSFNFIYLLSHENLFTLDMSHLWQKQTRCSDSIGPLLTPKTKILNRSYSISSTELKISKLYEVIEALFLIKEGIDTNISYLQIS